MRGPCEGKTVESMMTQTKSKVQKVLYSVSRNRFSSVSPGIGPEGLQGYALWQGDLTPEHFADEEDVVQHKNGHTVIGAVLS